MRIGSDPEMRRVSIHPHTSPAKEGERLIRIPINDHTLEGDYRSLERAGGVILFAHGTGNNRRCPRNQRVNGKLHGCGFTTLLIDLLTSDEKIIDIETRRPRFDVERLGERMVRIVDWLGEQPENRGLKFGCLASSTAAAAALIAAEARPAEIRSVVSLEGRIDIVTSILDRVRAPILCIVGERDLDLLELNRRALTITQGENRLEIIPGTRHIFEDPERADAINDLAQSWFLRHLASD